jgi:twitching motility two-component system response regulator PilG
VNDQAAFDVTAAPSRPKVLIVDDSRTIRRSAELFLKQAETDVILAEDGFQALGKIAQFRPQIIFCDIDMPRLDGFHTCAILKKSPGFSTTPFILLSSKDGIFDRARGNAVGADGYLSKPFSRESLVKMLQAHNVCTNTQTIHIELGP